MKKSILSFTRLKVFLRCPAQYRFQYIDFLESSYRSESPYLSQAKSLHQALYSFYSSSPSKKRSWKNLERALRESWIRKGYASISQEREYGLKALEILKDYYFQSSPLDEPVLLKHSFLLELEGRKIRGMIDRVDGREDGKLEVVKYRTAWSQDDDEILFQLRLYGLALEKQGQGEVGGHKIFLLRERKKECASWPRLWREETGKKLKEISERMEREEKFSPVPGDYCAHCPYELICPQWQEERDRLDHLSTFRKVKKDLYLLSEFHRRMSEKVLNWKEAAQQAVEALPALTGSERVSLFLRSRELGMEEGDFVEICPSLAPKGRRLVFEESFLIEGEVVEGIGMEEKESVVTIKKGQGNYLGLFLRDSSTSLEIYLFVSGAGKTDEFQKRLFYTLGQATMMNLAHGVLYLLAACDPLTQLYNRGQFQRTLRWMASSASEKSPVLLIICDIDHFKSFNDRFGHRIGDEVLRVFSKRLREVPGAYVFRYGGEEFAILLPVSGRKEEEEEMKRLIVSIRSMERIQSSEFEIPPITSSFGAALFPLDAQDTELWVEYADQSLYAAKEGGRNQFMMYHSKHSNSVSS